jgi:hypothetical protein
MATIGTVPCPGRCGGRIRLNASWPAAATGCEPGSVSMAISVDELDLRRHALCMAPPPDGEPLPKAA